MLRRCACGGKGECEECRKRGALRRSASSASAPGFAPPLVNEVLRSPGEPLDAATRAFMEPRFGHSFADVRVHADGRAARSAAAVSARAYAVGRDLVFGAGTYAPGSADGRRLIAHELAHVVQQSGGGAMPMASLEVGPVDAPEERQAEAAARRVMEGAPAMLGGGGAARVARLPVGSTEEMHHTLAERWRREQGLPPGGVDEHGQRVGPSDAELTYLHGAMDTRVPCPAPSSVIDLLCIGSTPAGQVTCRLTPEHHRLLGIARNEARTQVVGAARRIDAASPPVRESIMGQARRTFSGTPPTWEKVRETVLRMESILTGAGLRFEGGACGDETCHRPGVAGYVDDVGRLPIYICVRTFMPGMPGRLMKTVIHEVAHVAGVATADPNDERYCNASECGAECNGVEHADAWMQFITCVSGAATEPAGGAR